MKKLLLVLPLFLISLFLEAQVTLTGTSYTETFDGIGTGLPTGWTGRTGATTTALGTTAILTTAATAWNNTSGAFKNSASADGLTSTSTSANQSASTDRSLSLRQTGTVGDPGGAFVLQLSNTTGFANLALSFKLQSLDPASARTTTWVVDYGIGATPTSFTTISTGTITTGGLLFTSNTINANLGASAFNNANNIWIRIVALAASSGSGSRATTGIDDFTLTYTAASPTLSASSSSISDLNYFSGMGPSSAGIFNLSGSALTPAADNITVTAPTNFEVSTSATTGFADNLTIPYTGGNLASTPVYARLKTALSNASYNGNITFSGGGTSTNPTVALSGTVSPAVPTITVAPTSTTGLTYVIGTGPSTGIAYAVSGMFLTPAADNISIAAPTNFELSTTLAGTYSDNLTIPYTGGALSATNIYVRLKTGLAQNSFSGNIGHTGGGVTTAVNEAVSGIVTSVGTGACGTSTPIGTAKLSTIGTVITIQGRLSVDSEFGPNLFFIQDGNGIAGTGGIAIYFAAGNATIGASINAGDEVQVTGALALYQGKYEIANPTCFVKTSAPNLAVTPFVINVSEISMHEGELVKILNTTIGDETPVPATPTTKFVGARNYSYSTTSPAGTGELRIDVNSLLPNTLRPTTVTTLTGVIDHYVVTTPTAVNKYQILPRDADDIPGTTGGGAGAGACTTLGFSNIPVAQTLEVTAWNVEWLGNTTAGAKPLGPTNDAQQMTNVITVLNTLQSDVYCIEEVCDQNQFIARVASDMPGYGVKCSTTYYSHFFDTPETPGNATTYSQKVCFVYKTAMVSPINVETKALLSNIYTYPPGNNWASGRLPYMFVADVTLNSVTKKMNFVGLHAKSGSDATSYARRKQDVIDMKLELDTNYPNANLVILGDYNDDLDTSIYVGQPSSYKNFVNDNVRYVQISKVLSDCSVSSTAKYSDIIDHFMASNEFGVLPVTGTPPPVPSSGIYYLQNTVNVARPISYVASYTTSTSDHYPVTARFSFGIPVPPITSYETTTTGDWNVGSTWVGGNVPPTTADVIIKHNVTIPNAYTANAKNIKLNNGGTLTMVGTGAIGIN